MELLDEPNRLRYFHPDVYPNLPQRSRNNIARGGSSVSRRRSRETDSLFLSFFLSLSHIWIYITWIFFTGKLVSLCIPSFFLRLSSPILSSFIGVWEGLRAFLQREKVTFAFGTRLHRSCDGLLAWEQLRAGNEAQSRV